MSTIDKKKCEKMLKVFEKKGNVAKQEYYRKLLGLPSLSEEKMKKAEPKPKKKSAKKK